MKSLFLFIPAILLLSCSATKPQIIEKPVYLKCKTPEIPTAEIEKVPENANYPQKLQIILNNCLKIKRENELLRDAIKVCE